MSLADFQLRQHGTTFLAMAYIIVVNPAILRFAGLPAGASTVAPYMGENAFIASIVLAVLCLIYYVFGLPH